MVSVDDLSVDIDVNVKGLGQLSQLSTQLKEVAASQRLVDENQTIDVDAKMSGQLSQLAEGGLFDGEMIEGDFSKNLSRAVSDGIPDGGELADGGLADNISRATSRGVTSGFEQAELGDFIGDRDLGEFGVGDVSVRHSRDWMKSSEEILREIQTTNMKLDDIDTNIETGLDTGRGQLATLGMEGDIDVGDIRRRGGVQMASMLPDDGGRNITGIFSRVSAAAEDFREELTDADSVMGLLNLNMNHFYSLLAGLLPLLAVFIGAIPAGIAALGALATAAIGAAVALGGIGAVAAMGVAAERGDGDLLEGFEDIVDELTDSFKESFLPVARELQDLGLEGLEGLKEFGDQLAAVIDGFEYLHDDARAFGSYMQRNIPALIDMFGRLAESFGPLMGQFADWLENGRIMEGFVEVTEDALPPLMVLTNAFLSMLPVIAEISVGFMWVTSAIFAFWDAVWSVIDLFPGLTTGLGVVIGSMLALITVVATSAAAYGAYSAVITSGVIPALGSFITTLFGAQSAQWMSAKATGVLASVQGGYAALVNSTVITALVGYISTLYQATAAQYLSAQAASVLATALRGLLLASGIGILVAGVGLLAEKFLTLNDDVQEATKSLKEFENIQSNIGDTTMNGAYGVNWEGVDRGSQTNTTNNDVTVNNNGGDSGRTDKDVDKALFISNTMGAM